MNSNIMMLLPFIMGGAGGKNGGISADMLLKMMQSGGTGSASGGLNPMMLLLMNMMNKGKKQEPSEAAPQAAEKIDVSNMFGGDVANLLKLFMAANGHTSNGGT